MVGQLDGRKDPRLHPFRLQEQNKQIENKQLPQQNESRLSIQNPNRIRIIIAKETKCVRVPGIKA